MREQMFNFLKKLLFCLFFFTFAQKVAAQLPLIMGPAANESEFREFLEKGNNFISYTDLLFRDAEKVQAKIDESLLAELQQALIYFSHQDHDLQPSLDKGSMEDQIVKKMEAHSRRHQQSRSEVVLVIDFLKRASEAPDFHQKKWTRVIHFYGALGAQLDKGALTSNGGIKYKQGLPTNPVFVADEIQKSFPLILINGIPFKTNVIEWEKWSDAEFHWKLLSDRYQPMEADGSLDQLLRSWKKPSEWVSGDCEHSRFLGQDFILETSGSVFWQSQCQKPINSDIIKNNSWWHDNYSWAVPTSVLGVFLLNYLWDKKIVIKLP